MNHLEQRILIYTDDAQTQDRVVELCELCDASHLRISVAANPNELKDLFTTTISR